MRFINILLSAASASARCEAVCPRTARSLAGASGMVSWEMGGLFDKGAIQLSFASTLLLGDVDSNE